MDFKPGVDVTLFSPDGATVVVRPFFSMDRWGEPVRIDLFAPDGRTFEPVAEQAGAYSLGDVRYQLGRPGTG